MCKALKNLINTGLIFTSPNADTEGQIIKKMIQKFVNQNKNNSILINSMGAEVYLSTMKLVNCVLGNSSSGIIEAPILNTPTINIGDRQSGRVKSKSIFDCSPNEEKILVLINKLFSKKFKLKRKNVKSDFKLNNTSYKILKYINEYKFSNSLMKKFYDVKYE